DLVELSVARQVALERERAQDRRAQRTVGPAAAGELALDHRRITLGYPCRRTGDRPERHDAEDADWQRERLPRRTQQVREVGIFVDGEDLAPAARVADDARRRRRRGPEAHRRVR